jgi:hypothetical protein
MNITEKILFQQDMPNNTIYFSEFVLLLFIINYIFTNIYSLGVSYVNL